MSTPISKIQVNPNLPITGESHEDDPEVMAVLQEVAQEPRYVKPAQMQMQMPMQAPPQAPSHSHYGNGAMVGAAAGAGASAGALGDASWLHTDVAKRAVIAAIIAGVMFYPATFQILYDKIPALAKVASYDVFIRVAFLAVVLYILMWKLNI